MMQLRTCLPWTRCRGEVRCSKAAPVCRVKLCPLDETSNSSRLVEHCAAEYGLDEKISRMQAVTDVRSRTSQACSAALAELRHSYENGGQRSSQLPASFHADRFDAQASCPKSGAQLLEGHVLHRRYRDDEVSNLASCLLFWVHAFWAHAGWPLQVLPTGHDRMCNFDARLSWNLMASGCA